MSNQYIRFGLALLLLGSTYAWASASNNNQKPSETNLGLIEPDFPVDSLVVFTDNGLGTNLSVHISETKDTMFCPGHKFETEIKQRKEFDGDNEFNTADFKVSINGETLEELNIIENTQEFYHFGFEVICSSKHILLDLRGFNDSSASNGSYLLSLKIDAKTGEVVVD